MSRIGKQPVPIPGGVKCEMQGQRLKVTGPKGTLERDLAERMKVTIDDGEVRVERPSEEAEDRATHGLTRSLINNMVIGVTEGYEKTLQIEGVGYRAALQGKALNLIVGLSHPVVIDPPEGITFAVEGNTTIKVSGINKELVGQVAADVRGWRKPEPYKGKGIRYDNEYVRRKVGKAGAK